MLQLIFISFSLFILQFQPTHGIFSFQSFYQIGIFEIQKRIVQPFGSTLNKVGFSSELESILLPFWPITSDSEISKYCDHSFIPPIKDVNKDIEVITPLLKALRENEFFRKYRADLDGECPFWVIEGMCTSPEMCGICQCNDDEIPLPWKMKPIESFVDRRHYGNGDFYTPKENGYNLKGPLTYVDLSLNKPTYTGYKGQIIWQRIYDENCMGCPYPLSEAPGHISSNTVSPDDTHYKDMCVEASHFYRLISGMHTSIALHSSENHFQSQPNQDYGVHTTTYDNPPYPSYAFFREKVANFPERMANLYFLFTYILRSLCRLAPILEECHCDTGNPTKDLLARSQLMSLISHTFDSCNAKYAAKPLFNLRSEEAQKQIGNISRIMDCVECEKCRLLGKLKISALEVVTKLYSGGYEVNSLERNEITSLIAILSDLANSISYFHAFKKRVFWLRVKFICGCIFLIIFWYFFVTKIFKKFSKKSESSHIKSL